MELVFPPSIRRHAPRRPQRVGSPPREEDGHAHNPRVVAPFEGVSRRRGSPEETVELAQVAAVGDEVVEEGRAGEGEEDGLARGAGGQEARDGGGVCERLLISRGRRDETRGTVDVR